jgi:hypothetical protein
MPNRIVLLAPERLHAIIDNETQAGRRAALAEALLRLLHLHSEYIGRPHDECPDHREKHERVGTIMPCTERTGSSILQEFGWAIIQDPRPNGHGGTHGDHVLNGGLIQHGDFAWQIHT